MVVRLHNTDQVYSPLVAINHNIKSSKNQREVLSLHPRSMGQGYRAAAYAQGVVFWLEPETIGDKEFYTLLSRTIVESSLLLQIDL